MAIRTRIAPRSALLALAASLAAALTLAGDAARAVAQAPALVTQAHEVQGAVAEIRGLSFLHAVSMAVKDRPAIRAYAVSRLDREYSAEDFRAKSESLIAWGFVPRPFDLRAFYAELLTEQIGGYYDPFEGVFFIADWLPPLLQKPIMAHELTHALQDQHFDLKPLLRGVDDNDDASLAQAAVVEGEGLAVMIDYALRPVGLTFEKVPDLQNLVDAQLGADSAGFEVYASAPPIFKETLLFPYLRGLLFVRAAKERGGWGELSRVYDALPASTEQVLWPEKYFDRPDLPTPITLPDVAPLLGAGWRRIDSNVLGELGLRVALRAEDGSLDGVEPARGWDGDRYELYEREPGETALVSVSLWDSEAEAVEFERAWRARFETQPDRDGTWVVDRDGRRVVLSLGAPRGRRERLARALLEAAPESPRR
ncbi:MAG: hypothetical protein ABR599_06570 [Gemmatimonadota bacterium]